MDSAHEAELARILAKRKSDGRAAVGGLHSSAAGGLQHSQSASVYNPTNSTSGNFTHAASASSFPSVGLNQPLSSPSAGPSPASPAKQNNNNNNNNNYNSNINSGAIVIEDAPAAANSPPGGFKSSSYSSAGAAEGRNSNNYGSASGTSNRLAAPPSQSQIHYQPPSSNNTPQDSELSEVLREIQKQNQMQAQQLRSLQGTIEHLVEVEEERARSVSGDHHHHPHPHAPPPPSVKKLGSSMNATPRSLNANSAAAAASGGGGGSGVVPPRPSNLRGTTTSPNFDHQHPHNPNNDYKPDPPASMPTATKRAPVPGATDLFHQQQRMDKQAQHWKEPSVAEESKQKQFYDATALGLVTRPTAFVTESGTRMISFASPSRNERGISTAMASGFASPTSASRGLVASAAGGNNSGGKRSASGGRNKQRSIMNVNKNNNNSFGSPSPAGKAADRRRALEALSDPAFNMPATVRKDAIPKPYSTSTVDVDSAVVLLTTGDWFYKLRVNISGTSVIGPAGWQILTSERRYVYLDTTTYMLRWGDKPRGSATIFSHYVPIDHIVGIQIFSQNETTRGPEPRTVYYITMNVCEGGFRSARGRHAQKRLCVIATELRDKADMWYDALNSVVQFYRGRATASTLSARTFSSD